MSERKKTRVVVVGGGFAGVYFLKRLHRQLHVRADVEVYLVNPDNFFLFTPLLHEVATGGIFPENIVESLREVVGCCLTDFYHGSAVKVRRADRVVETTAGELSYDFLVLATGATTAYFGTQGAEEHCYTLKSLHDALTLKARFIDMLERATKIEDPLKRSRMLHFVVIGGGPTGVELAAEMAEFFEETLRSYYARFGFEKELRITLVQKGKEVLPQFSPRMRRKAAQVLTKKGIDLKLGVGVKTVEAEHLVLEDGSRLDALTSVWVAGVCPNLPTFDEPLETDRSGRIVVTPDLRALMDDRVYALGDVMSYTQSEEVSPLPMLAQVAVAAGRVAADNLARRLSRRRQTVFRYRSLGHLVSLGQWAAIAEIGRLHAFGHIVWWLWRTVYLSKLLSWQKKLQVVLDWTIDLFLPRDISRF